MWTRCTGLFTYNSEPVICRDFSLLSPPAIISNPLSPANTFLHSITWYTSRVSLLGPSSIVRKPGNIGNLCSTGSKFNFQVTESLGQKEKLCMNSHVLYRVQTSHWPTIYVTYTEAYSQPYKTTFLVSQLKVYCIISTKWLINHIHTLYMSLTFTRTSMTCLRDICHSVLLAKRLLSKDNPGFGRDGVQNVHTAGTQQQWLGQLIKSEHWPAGVFLVCFERLSIKLCASQ